MVYKKNEKDFQYNVETLATCKDKAQLYDEILELKNNNGFSLLEILTALNKYDEPKYKKQRDRILTENCENILKVELLIYDFGNNFFEFNVDLQEKSVEELLKDLESDRFKVKDVLNVSVYPDCLKTMNFNKINPLKENVHSKIDKELFLQHGFHLVRIDCYKENTENKRYVYCRIKDIYNQGDLSNLVISEQTIDLESNIIFDTLLEHVFINCDRLDQDLMLLIVAKTFELGWGVHSKLIDLNNTIINNYKNRISQENNARYDEIYNNPLNWIKSLNIPDNQLSFYNEIFTIDTSLKNIINIVMKIQKDGHDISNYEMLKCHHLKNEDNYDDAGELYMIFKNKLSNEEFLILYDINTLNISFGYTTKNGENFSPLYDIKTCIDHFDSNYCYLYR